MYGPIKPQNEWCSNCEGKNFVLRPLADQEVYAALIEEDWNMMGWFVSVLVGIAMASGLTWMVLSAWLKT